jgi:predicted Zn-dependent protease
VDGEHILSATADVAGPGLAGSSRGLVIASLTHELGHCLGLDDSTDVRSFMWYPTGVPAGAGLAVSSADADAVQLKYSRRAGATFGERDED